MVFPFPALASQSTTYERIAADGQNQTNLVFDYGGSSWNRLDIHSGDCGSDSQAVHFNMQSVSDSVITMTFPESTVSSAGFLSGCVNDAYTVTWTYSDSTTVTENYDAQSNSNVATMYENISHSVTDKFITSVAIVYDDYVIVDDIFWTFGTPTTTTTSTTTTSTTTTSTTTTSTTTTSTTTTTLDPLTIERNNNFSETGIYETNQEREDREYDEYLAELEAERLAAEEAARLAEEQRLNEEREANFNETGILETDDERIDREEAEYQAELDANFLETGFYETNEEREEREELEYQIYLEELEAEAEAEILAELEDSIDLETLGLVVVDCIEGDEECENLTDDEIAEIEADLQEFIDTIQEIEETVDFEDYEIEEEIIELEDINLDDDVVVIIIEELEDQEQTDQVPIIEDYDSDEIEEVKEIEEVIEIVEDVIPELPDDIVEPEEAEEIIEEFVESLEVETKVEIIEDVVEVGVEELTEEQVVVVQEVVESAIEDVEVLSEEQVETVAEVLGLEESDDVGVIAEAVKTDEAVAEAVESFVERAVENKEVEDYNLSDVVVEVQVEEFLENPAVIFDVDFEEIDFAGLGDDLTNQQKEKAQEVVVPVIIASQIISASVVPFRRLN